jgi:hypothetical protein
MLDATVLIPIDRAIQIVETRVGEMKAERSITLLETGTGVDFKDIQDAVRSALDMEMSENDYLDGAISACEIYIEFLHFIKSVDPDYKIVFSLQDFKFLLASSRS